MEILGCDTVHSTNEIYHNGVHKYKNIPKKCLLTYISSYDISDLMSCLDVIFIHFLLKCKISTGLTSVKVDKFPARSL